MNPAETNQPCNLKIDASCRLPLLVLFGGAALWLVVGLAVALLASLVFHAPEMLAGCSCLTYGHLAPLANDLLVYGFAIPAALGVMLWIFARLSQVELVLPLVPFAGANLWHLGILIGIATVLTGNSSGYLWLEFLRPSAMLLGVGFVLIAISAVATFGQRKERELYPSHWFLLGSLLWFPWIYSTANLFLVTSWPVRGVAQAVINWWYADNLIFVWLGLAGIGIAFYFLPKFAGRPLQSRFYALFFFWTLMVFGTWAGIPQGAPVPAWYPVGSSFATFMLIIPSIALVVILRKTLKGSKTVRLGGPFCYMRFGTGMFIVSTLLVMALACPSNGPVLDFTWLAQAQVQLQILGVAGMILLGAIYEIFPAVMGTELPFKGFVKAQHWLFLIGILVYVVSLAFAGWQQSKAGFTPESALPGLRISTLGLLLLLIGSVLLLVNVLIMTIRWKLGLAKMVISAVKAPLETSEVKP
jgi:cytochrome c oxidase cbb3-type subunit 1